jgi:hypothetical protein
LHLGIYTGQGYIYDFATDIEIIEDDTGAIVGDPMGYHSHYVQLYTCCYCRPVTALIECSLGHVGCHVVPGDLVFPIGYGSGPVETTSWGPSVDFVVETLTPGWTATLLTLTPPSYITQSWALVRGDLQVLEADYKGVYLGFDFGKTINYNGQQWYNPPLGTTLIKHPLKFAANIGGLAPGNEYHYRAKVQLGNTVNSALLRGSLTLTGEAYGVPTTLSFEWGETDGYGNTVFVKTASYSTTFSAVLNGLDPETTYHYRAMAVNALGTVYGADIEFTVAGIYYGEDQSFETLSGPPIPPEPPPIFGYGNNYYSAKQAIENVSGISLARDYADNEGNFQHESRFRRRV